MTDIDKAALEALGLSRQGAPGNSKDGKAERLGQDDFMKLMVTQLTNQDPFDPMESGDFLGQLAQFGTVSGIDAMEKSLSGLGGALRSNQTLQAAGLVDRDVLVPAREAWLPPDGEVRGTVQVPAGTEDVTLGIYDMSGERVQQLRLGEVRDGQAEFTWNGSAEEGAAAVPGFYELRAEGAVAGTATALDAHVAGRVESVSVGGPDGRLALTVTGLGVVDFEQVRTIR